MEGGRRAGGASDGDEKEGARRRASFHADQHGQPGVDVQESRAMEGGRRAGGASDGDENEVGRGRAWFRADQHGQPGVDVQESRAIEGGRRAGGASDGDELERERERVIFNAVRSAKRSRPPEGHLACRRLSVNLCTYRAYRISCKSSPMAAVVRSY